MTVDDLPAVRRGRVTWADTIEPEPVVWAWRDDSGGRIPSGSLSIAAGREGTGKSSCAMHLAAQITRGTLPGSFHGTPRRVFYVAMEDSWRHTLVPRLLAADADLTKVGRFDVVLDDDLEVALSLPTDNKVLEEEILANGVAMVVIDPLMSVIGERIDTHRERDVRTALDPLVRIADRTGCVILGIAHFSKGAGTDAASLITGSGAFKNVPRSVFGFARDDGDDQGGRVMTQVKNSLGRDDLPSLSYVIQSIDIQTPKGIANTGRFTFTGVSERTVEDLLRESRGTDQDAGSDRQEVGDWLLDYLAGQGGAASAKDVSDAGKLQGYSIDTLKRAKKRTGVCAEKHGFEGGWAWVAPSHMPADQEGDDPEESNKGAKSAGVRSLHPSPPSALPSGSADTVCPLCGCSFVANGRGICPSCDRGRAAS